jgi:hypothetical protein
MMIFFLNLTYFEYTILYIYYRGILSYKPNVDIMLYYHVMCMVKALFKLTHAEQD